VELGILKRITSKLLLASGVPALFAAAVGTIFLPGFGACRYLSNEDAFERKGGIRLVLQVITDEAVALELDHDALRISRDLKANGIAFDSSRRVSDGFSIEVSGLDPERVKGALGRLNDAGNQGYDIVQIAVEGKAVLVLSLREEQINRIREATVRRCMETIQRRMYDLGAVGLRLRLENDGGLEGRDRIILEIPDVDDPDRLKALISNTAQLKLRMVHPKYDSDYPSIASAMEAAGAIPEGYQLLECEDGARNASPQYMIVSSESVISGNDLKTARCTTDAAGSPAVSFFLTAEGGERLEETTAEHIGERMAIVINDRVHSAPTINSKIGAEGIISGSFTMQEAEDMALLLRSGALPASLKIIHEIRVLPASQ
jgi:preprotein translocase subunit SecD